MVFLFIIICNYLPHAVGTYVTVSFFFFFFYLIGLSNVWFFWSLVLAGAAVIYSYRMNIVVFSIRVYTGFDMLLNYLLLANY